MSSSSKYSGYDDAQLISMIAQQREEALAELYERYNRIVFSLALAIVNDWGSAEEITLDVFMRIWQKADSYRSEQARVSTWLTHIARHHAIDVLRRRAVRLDHSALDLDQTGSRTAAPDQDVQESVELSLRRQRVQAALAQLPPEQKEVMLLAYFSGYTQSQIADRLQQPLGTVKTRLRLAMQKLQHILYPERSQPAKSEAGGPAYNLAKED